MSDLRSDQLLPVHRDRCEDEPIVFARSIQPIGVLLCVDNIECSIIAASANHGIIPCLGELVIGRSLQEVWPQLEKACAEGTSMLSDDFMVTSHTNGQTIFLEIEPCIDEDRTGPVQLAELASVLLQLRDAPTLDLVTHAAAVAIQKVTGMERVLVYHFDKDGHGEVVAESKVNDWEESFIGFHFPSADIPAQARALYLNSPSRFVPHRDYEPVPILPELDPRTGQPFDLGGCRMRSVSPMHRLYQENLGVDGSMSLSIIEGGRLWGLVVGHHRRPHRVPIPARDLAMAIATSLSMRLAATETVGDRAARARHAVLHAKLLQQIAGADDFVSPLVHGEVKLQDLFFASGGAVVVCGGDDDSFGAKVFTVGRCPDRDAILAFSAACRQHMEDGIFHTDHAAAILPAFSVHANYASGVLATSIGEEGRHLILWFRPETVQTKVWGGASPDQVAKEKSVGNYLPRKSFERWVEERRGSSLPWRHWQIDIARSVHAALNEVMLRHLRTLRTLEVKAVLQRTNVALKAHGAELEEANRKLSDARTRAEAADKVKSEFLSVMNHEFHTPLNAVIGFASLLTAWEETDPADPDYRSYCKRILSGGKSLLALLDDILKLSKMAAGDLTLHCSPFPLCQLIESAVLTVQAQAESSGVSLVVDGGDHDVAVDGDERLLNKALVHLLLNGIKFSRPGGTVKLSTGHCDDGSLQLMVADDGIGIAAADVERAMAPFMQADGSTTRRYEGAGIGLPLAQRLVEKHGGKLELDSTTEVGTTVTISIPRERVIEF